MLDCRVSFSGALLAQVCLHCKCFRCPHRLIDLTEDSIISCTILILIQRVQEPFRCHLFGVMRQALILPLTTPKKNPPLRPMYSEMSFKCRSSASMSSRTLVASHNPSKTTLTLNKLDKAVGLGIYTSEPSFLTPRPSLSSIRTHTTMQTIPRHSPVPPLPTYFPKQYRKRSAAHKAVYPPRRPPRPECTPGGRTVRAVPSTPSLSIANLKEYNRSIESLSSTYSRSVSGERRSPKGFQTGNLLTVGARSYTHSSESTATMKKSPLGIVRMASHPDVPIRAKCTRDFDSSSDSDIDDTTTLQERLSGRLPIARSVSDFGDVKYWTDCQTVVHTSPVVKGSRRRPSLHRLAMRKSKEREVRPDYRQHGVGVAKTYRLLEPWQY